MSDIDRTDRCWHCKGAGACADWCHIRTFPSEADLERRELRARLERRVRDVQELDDDVMRLRDERDRARRLAVELENQLAAIADGVRRARTDCPFCEIAAGRAPATVVREWPDALAIVPLDPVTPGHLLIIPRVHVADFIADPAVSGLTAQRTAELAGELGLADANEITSRGPAATQTVRHLHRHLVPRAVGDGLALPWASA